MISTGSVNSSNCLTQQHGWCNFVKRFKKAGDKDDVDNLPSDVKLTEELLIKDAQKPLYPEIKKENIIE